MQQYFTSILQQYEKFRGQTIDKELDSTFWDVVVLTAADEAQKNVYEKQLKYKYERQELPVNVEIIVVADPPGPKIGNGGSTIVALEVLHEKFGKKLYDYRVLIIHAGGQSQRMPSASVLGKIFSPIPRGNPIYQMLDIKLAMFYPLIPKMPKGVFVTCADDFLVYDLGDSHDDIKFCEEGFTVLAHPSSLAVGTGHGVYVIHDIGNVNPRCPLQVCNCLEVLQKPSEVLMYKKGAVLKANDLEFPDGIKVEDSVAYTDSSFFFAHDISKKLLSFATENGPLSCEIDAYGDFLQALGPRATSAYINNTSNVSIVTPSLLATRKKIFNLLNKSNITVLVMNCSKFIHIGTTKEYIEHFCCDVMFQAEMGLEKDVFNLWTRNISQISPVLKCGSGDASDLPLPPKRLKLSDTSQGCVMHSYLHDQSFISATSVIEFCSFSIPIKVGQCCILSNLEFKADIRIKDAEGKTPSLVEYMNTVKCLDFPNDLFVHTIPLTDEGQSTKFVTVFFDIKDNLKKEAPGKDIKQLAFLGKLVEDFTAVTNEDIAKVIPDNTDAKFNLWNTNLFPVTDDASESLLLALKCVDAVKTDKSGIVSLGNYRLVSMATVLKERDLDVMLEKRNVLYNTIKSERNKCSQ
ncbi:fucose-1-phosphate guanylyltransferase-like [Ruditapes philippinarum]|uniref:fucose-1-phosphate guanylyltransferase-like n=1 Tax=Ruditapes philippinarum TaxID=129788 RepID=UPI00295A8ACE|nr:fucose-1-phosphate guanylyltransferase-like [Ruditapes philippinarum]